MTSTVVENAGAVPIGIGAPVDSANPVSDLIVSVTQLPDNGVVSLADGTAVMLGATLTVDQLTQLRFTPAPHAFDESSAFNYTVSDPDGSVMGTAVLNIGPAVGNPIAPSTTKNIPFNVSGGLQLTAPSDPNYDASQLTVTIVGLPSNGAVYTQEGAQVSAGQTMSVAAFTALQFATGERAFNQSADLTYAVADPDGNSSSGTITLSIGPVIGSPAAPSITVVVAENANPSLNLPAPTDVNFAASNLTVTLLDLPANGVLAIADGTPAVAGAAMSVAQFTGLQFTPSPGAFNQSSGFDYQVTDSAGNTDQGSVELVIGPAIGDPVADAVMLTVAENADATSIGIVAPSDPNYATDQLSIRVGDLPNDGAVSLADGTAVTSGESITADELSGLQFTPTAGLFDQASTFTYTVSDPSGNQSEGSAQLMIGPALNTDPVTGATLPAITTGGAGAFKVTDVPAARSGTNDGTAYTGPVAYLQQQFVWDGSDAIALKAETPSVFIKGGTAGDALQVTGGNNVLDGGGGSNFLVGADGSDGGADVFYVDARGAAITWSTIVNFHAGDEFTLWGFQAGTSTEVWDPWSGATGYQGASLHSETNGPGTGVNASVTLAGISQEIADSQFTVDAGDIDGTPYLHITYNA